MTYHNIKTKIQNNKSIVINVLGAFIIKGLGLIVNLIALPLYISYFNDNAVLGVWFTILSVLNWILSFDVGIGNGLRNHLTVALTNKDYEEGKRLISSSYLVLGALTLFISVVFYIFLPCIDWNSFFNISDSVILADSLMNCIRVTLIGLLISFFLHLVRGMLFSLQLASINNLIHLVTSVLLVAFLFVVQPDNLVEEKLKLISYAYAILINIPFVVATIWIFLFSELKNCRPSIRYFNKAASNKVLGLGVVFFLIQILYMIITVTNEWFITKFFHPEDTVNYQVYFRIFSLVGSLLLLSMAPLWSAITKAYAEKKYSWIIKIQKFLYFIAFACIILEIAIIPVLQPLVNLWLKGNSTTIDYFTATSFALYGVITIWIAIQSTIVAGLGKLKIQFWLYLVAVITKIILIVVISNFTERWELVMWATGIGLLPYCLIQPMYIKRLLTELDLNINHR